MQSKSKSSAATWRIRNANIMCEDTTSESDKSSTNRQNEAGIRGGEGKG